MAMTTRTSQRLRRRRRQSPRRHGPTPRHGFTLISMIVAIVLLTVGIMALGNANTNTIKYQTLAQNRTNAVAIGRAYLEEVRVRNPWSLASESAVQVGADGVASASGFYSRSMEVTEERGNLLRVEVLVDFPRAEQPVKLITYQYRGNGLAGTP
jgi:Tfp pilus assembly protein PilV